MARLRVPVIALAFLGAFAACKPSAAPPPAPTSEAGADANGFSAPTSYTRPRRPPSRARCRSPTRRTSRTRKRGLVAERSRGRSSPAPTARRSGTPQSYGFVQGDAPASVNPSLWRQAKLNGIHGLFEVADGVYQVRGYDVSNMTLIRGQDRLDRRRSAHERARPPRPRSRSRARTSATCRSSP